MKRIITEETNAVSGDISTRLKVLDPCIGLDCNYVSGIKDLPDHCCECEHITCTTVGVRNKHLRGQSVKTCSFYLVQFLC